MVVHYHIWAISLKDDLIYMIVVLEIVVILIFLSAEHLGTKNI